MGSYAELSKLPLVIESYSLEGISFRASAEFERHTTVVCLEGKGERGFGEDLCYDTIDQRRLQQAGPNLPLAGSFDLAGFSRLLDTLELFPRKPSQAGYRDYRRWTFESAALDLALCQAGESLASLLGRTPSAVRFVSSMSLGHPPRVDAVERWLELYPELEFKLDVAQAWDDALVERLAATKAVRVLDLKGAYHGTPVDLAPDPLLYARVARAFPDAWIEDPAWTPETESVLHDHRQRITWDAPIHSVDDIRRLPFRPERINFKSSRFGRLEELLDGYDYCRDQGIEIYGGGQWELGPGRAQIQYLAALLHGDAPNDVAPRGYNAAEPSPGLPTSPLAFRPAATGFREEAQ